MMEASAKHVVALHVLTLNVKEFRQRWPESVGTRVFAEILEADAI